jgi:hypothetical protein
MTIEISEEQLIVNDRHRTNGAPFSKDMDLLDTCTGKHQDIGTYIHRHTAHSGEHAFDIDGKNYSYTLNIHGYSWNQIVQDSLDNLTRYGYLEKTKDCRHKVATTATPVLDPVT